MGKQLRNFMIILFLICFLSLLVSSIYIYSNLFTFKNDFLTKFLGFLFSLSMSLVFPLAILIPFSNKNYTYATILGFSGALIFSIISIISLGINGSNQGAPTSGAPTSIFAISFVLRYLPFLIGLLIGYFIDKSKRKIE